MFSVSLAQMTAGLGTTGHTHWASVPAETTRVPSGVKATAVTQCLVAAQCLTDGHSVSAVHTRTSPSAPPEANRFPSGLNARVRTASACPLKGSPTAAPVVTSQSRSSPSLPALTR